MIHPGYFIVHDTGGAIKGTGRFDVFTGTLSKEDNGNIFGTYGDLSSFGDANQCAPEKQMSQTLREGRNSGAYFAAMAAINNATNPAPVIAPTLVRPNRVVTPTTLVAQQPTVQKTFWPTSRERGGGR